MVFFGVGSMFGSWMGGKLTDKIGFYKVMIWSLLISGFLSIGLQYVDTFYGFCIAMLVIMSVADMFRPAIFVSLKAYSKPENRVRSLTLVRLAINLGFVVGPSVAGLIIIARGYTDLFWIDGVTCILAIILFRFLVKERKSVKEESKDKIDFLDTQATVYKDKPYWIFLGITFLMGMIFFQVDSRVFYLPLFHKQ